MARPREDITGRKYGRWTVLNIEKRGYLTYYKCQCECGTIKTIHGGGLVYGKSKSCGCLAREGAIKRTKHGHSRTETTGTSTEYRSWQSMKARCLNPKCKEYNYYGGRGISVCDRWLGEHGFENFFADMGNRPAGKSLDRYPNNDGNYEPSNCRWGTTLQQAGNRRTNVWFEYGGKRMILADWARELNADQESIRVMLKTKSIAHTVQFYTRKNQNNQMVAS